MKNLVKRVKDLKLFLKDLEPFIRNWKQLYDGRPQKVIGLRPRELLGNWLVCAVANYRNKNDNLTIGNDLTGAIGGDGIICNTKINKGYRTEHVMRIIEENSASAIENMIIESIKNKQDEGVQYASGKILVVFLWGCAKWFPDKVASLLKQPLLFEAIWLFALDDTNQEQYVYDVVEFCDNSFQLWKVIISKEFDSWTVVKN